MGCPSSSEGLWPVCGSITVFFPALRGFALAAPRRRPSRVANANGDERRRTVDFRPTLLDNGAITQVDPPLPDQPSGRHQMCALAMRVPAPPDVGRHSSAFPPLSLILPTLQRVLQRGNLVAPGGPWWFPLLRKLRCSSPLPSPTLAAAGPDPLLNNCTESV